MRRQGDIAQHVGFYTTEIKCQPPSAAAEAEVFGAVPGAEGGGGVVCAGLGVGVGVLLTLAAQRYLR